MSQAIKVQIFGQSYSVQGDLDEAYVQKLAVLVDEKMHAIAQMTPTMATRLRKGVEKPSVAGRLPTFQFGDLWVVTAGSLAELAFSSTSTASKSLSFRFSTACFIAAW